MVQLQGHFDTGRTSFIQWMFSKEGLGEQWDSRAAGEAGTGGRALPWHYEQGASMGQ
jgi:hypothetical protein